MNVSAHIIVFQLLINVENQFLVNVLANFIVSEPVIGVENKSA